MSEITTAQGSLVMMGLNTPTPQVYLNGALVEGIIGISVVNNATTQNVVLKFHEDPKLELLRAAGVVVRVGGAT